MFISITICIIITITNVIIAIFSIPMATIVAITIIVIVNTIVSQSASCFQAEGTAIATLAT